MESFVEVIGWVQDKIVVILAPRWHILKKTFAEGRIRPD
jgi:hypothetical protein